jgi:hypothetical protein
MWLPLLQLGTAIYHSTNHILSMSGVQFDIESHEDVATRILVVMLSVFRVLRVVYVHVQMINECKA